MGVRILHFSDAHIDTAAGGKRDPSSGLPVRVNDFLSALDQIVDSAIQEKVDLVLFAGDAYRNPTPVPTYQREWGKRMMRLADAKIPVLMLTGNHDVAPATSRASSLQEYETLAVPYLHLARTIRLWGPQDLNDVPLQVLTVPWASKSTMIAALGLQRLKQDEQNTRLEAELSERIHAYLDDSDPALPLVLMAHYAVPGAKYSKRQSVMIGREVLLSPGLVKDDRIAYTALGHIHRHQDLNPGNQPPVVYSGSTERVDFGESDEEKGFVLVDISGGQASYTFHRLAGRRFYNLEIMVQSAETFQQEVLNVLPSPEKAEDAMVRLVLTYPREWEPFLDENELRKRMNQALEFHLIRKPTQPQRIRALGDGSVMNLEPSALLRKYCEVNSFEAEDTAALLEQAAAIFDDFSGL